MEIAALAGGGAVMAWSGAKTLFSYNQGLWQFDKGQRQNKVYQAQGMAISQVGLWREDLRDLFDLTNTKMNNYTTISTLVLGFNMQMFTDFHLDDTTPTWLFIAGSTLDAAACAFALLSMVFSMHAGIVVQQFQTKTMTEIVRLPIPDGEQITQGSALGREFEDPRNMRVMMRIPVVGSKSKVHKVGDDTTATIMTPFTSGDPHTNMFQQMQVNWIPLANFARVSMVSSLTCTSYSLMYFVIAKHLAQNRQVFGVVFAVLILSSVNLLVQKLDFLITPTEWIGKAIVHMGPPILAVITQIGSTLDNKRWAEVAPIFIFFLHGLWLLFLLKAAHPATEGGKSKFRLTILQDLQFGKPARQNVAPNLSESIVSAGTMASPGSMGSAGTMASARSMASSTTKDSDVMQAELQQYHRTAAGLLLELQQLKGGGASSLLEEFRLLSRQAGEPEDPKTVCNSTLQAPSSSLGSQVGISTNQRGEQTVEIRFVDKKNRITTPQPHGLATNDGVVFYRGSGFPLRSDGLAVPDGTFYYVRVVGPYQLDLHSAVALDAQGDHDKSLVNVAENSGAGAQLRKAALECSIGHTLKEKHGQSVFHLKGRFCALCRSDLQRTDTRYTCDVCSKYDVCVACAKAIQQKMFGNSTVTTQSEDTEKKAERMLKMALADLRVRVQSKQGGGQRRSSMAKLGSTIAEQVTSQDGTKELPTPILEDNLLEALSCEAVRDVDNLPWEIFRSLTTVIAFCFFVAFWWAVVNACTPNMSLGRPWESSLTSRSEYLDLGGEERRLAARPQGPEETSQPQEVAEWFRGMGREEAACQAEDLSVDGDTLRYLDGQGWAELGVTSSVERAKLLARLAGANGQPTWSGGLGGGSPRLPPQNTLVESEAGRPCPIPKPRSEQ